MLKVHQNCLHLEHIENLLTTSVSGFHDFLVAAVWSCPTEYHNEACIHRKVLTSRIARVMDCHMLLQLLLPLKQAMLFRIAGVQPASSHSSAEVSFILIHGFQFISTYLSGSWFKECRKIDLRGLFGTPVVSYIAPRSIAWQKVKVTALRPSRSASTARFKEMSASGIRQSNRCLTRQCLAQNVIVGSLG